MDTTPSDLWQIIEKYMHFEDKLNIKQTCKQFRNLFISSNTYISTIQMQLRRQLLFAELTYSDLIKYIIRQNDTSISDLANIVHNIKTKKSIISSNCVHIPYLLSHDTIRDAVQNDIFWQTTSKTCEYVRCILCNMEYKCRLCSDIYSDTCMITDIYSDTNGDIFTDTHGNIDPFVEEKSKGNWQYNKVRCFGCKRYVMSYSCCDCGKLSIDCVCNQTDYVMSDDKIDIDSL